MATELTLDSTRESITYDFFSLTKWSPMATEINREEFLGISFSHHMEILHKTKNINEVLCCIHEAVVHQWDKYTLRDMLKAGIPQPDHTVPNNFPQTISICSQRQSKVLVMVESEEPENPKMGQESRKCGHLKMQVIKDLKKDTFEAETAKGMELNSTDVMDNLPGHTGVEKAVAVSMKQTVPGKEAPKVLPWVHIAIANAKTLFQDMYHGIKDEFLQWYLDEYCYKFNRKYFGDRVFDRLMIAATSYKPTFAHRLYNKNLCAICG